MSAPADALQQDARFMALALALGRRGLGRTWPNPAVGAVIVKDGIIIGRGWTQPGGRPHAEIEALRRAGETSRGATLYVTARPTPAIPKPRWQERSGFRSPDRVFMAAWLSTMPSWATGAGRPMPPTSAARLRSIGVPMEF